MYAKELVDSLNSDSVNIICVSVLHIFSMYFKLNRLICVGFQSCLNYVCIDTYMHVNQITIKRLLSAYKQYKIYCS